MIIKKIILVFTLLVFSGHNLAFTKEVTIELSNYALPFTQIEIFKGTTTWSMSRRVESNFVGLFRLKKEHAKSLLKTSERAKKYYAQVIKSGRCPAGKIKSSPFGYLESSSNKIIFDVVCEKNNIKLEYAMINEDGINTIISKIDWQDLNHLATSVLAYYK